MRLTVLGQYAKGLKHHDREQADEAERLLEKIKWYLWNGNVRDALLWAACLADELWSLDSDYPSLKRFARTAAEFRTYVVNNAGAIPNYASAGATASRSPRRSSSPRSTSWSASASPSGNRCSGHREARTCCCRPGRGCSTARCGRPSPGGTPALLPTTKMAQHLPRQPESPTVCDAPASR
jgi:hypothetical protein